MRTWCSLWWITYCNSGRFHVSASTFFVHDGHKWLKKLQYALENGATVMLSNVICSKSVQKYQCGPFPHDHPTCKAFILQTYESYVRFSQLVAVDVILKHGLLHVVTDHRAEGTHSVTLLVLLQFVLGYAGEALLAVTTHQRLLRAEIETASQKT